MGLPAVQVIMIMARQVSKPIADRLISYSQGHPFLRKKMLIPLGRTIDRWAVKTSQKFSNGLKIDKIEEATEPVALAQASELIQQVLLFGYSVGVYAIYYWHSKKNEKPVVLEEVYTKYKEEMETRVSNLENQVADVTVQLEKSNQSIYSTFASTFTRPKPVPEPVQPPKQDVIISSIPFDQALQTLRSPVEPEPGKIQAVIRTIEDQTQ